MSGKTFSEISELRNYLPTSSSSGKPRTSTQPSDMYASLQHMFPNNPGLSMSGQGVVSGGSPSQVRRPSASKERGNSPGGAGTPTTMTDDWGTGSGRRTSKQQHQRGGQGSSRTTPTRGQQSSSHQNGRFSTGNDQATERAREQLFEKALEASLRENLPQSMQNVATFDSSATTIVQVMTHIEAAFWAYIDKYSKGPQFPVSLPRFERGLLKDFTVEVLKRAEHLCQLWPDAPKGGVDCDKDEVNKRKVAEYYHRLFCEHKMSLPAAGVVLLSQDGKKLLMVRSTLCGDGFTLPKEKQRLGEQPMATAGRILTGLTADASLTSSLVNARVISFAINRFSVKQQQTLYLIPGVAETSVPEKEGVRSWEPLANMPYLDGVALGRPSIGAKHTGKYETIVLFLEKLAQPISDVLADMRAGRHLDGPAVRMTEAPPRILDYSEVRERLIASKVFNQRWSNIEASRPRPTPPLPITDMSRKRDALRLTLMKQLVDVSS